MWMWVPGLANSGGQYQTHHKTHSSPPVLLDSSAQSNLLSYFCTHWLSEHYLSEVSLHCTDPTASGQRAYVHHQHLILAQLLDLQYNGECV